MGKITETVKVLLIVNVIFFLGSSFLGDRAYLYFAMWFPENENFRIWQIVTHMFMHGDFFHLLFNMYGLYAFGSAVESFWGQKRFLFFYFSAGLGAVGLQVLLTYIGYNNGIQDLLDLGITTTEITEFFALPRNEINPEYMDLWNKQNVPMVGASGAVYGILVAFGIYVIPKTIIYIFKGIKLW